MFRWSRDSFIDVITVVECQWCANIYISNQPDNPIPKFISTLDITHPEMKWCYGLWTVLSPQDGLFDTFYCDYYYIYFIIFSFWEDAVSSSLRCFTTLRGLQEQDTKKFPISSNILWLASPVFLLHSKCNRLIESNCSEVTIFFFFSRTANWDSSFSKNTGITTTWEKPICTECHHSAGPSASRKAVIMSICQISHPNRDGL